MVKSSDSLFLISCLACDLNGVPRNEILVSGMNPEQRVIRYVELLLFISNALECGKLRNSEHLDDIGSLL